MRRLPKGKHAGQEGLHVSCCSTGLSHLSFIA
jgi:hypothetical protein